MCFASSPIPRARLCDDYEGRERSRVAKHDARRRVVLTTRVTRHPETTHTREQTREREQAHAQESSSPIRLPRALYACIKGHVRLAGVNAARPVDVPDRRYT